MHSMYRFKSSLPLLSSAVLFIFLITGYLLMFRNVKFLHHELIRNQCRSFAEYLVLNLENELSERENDLSLIAELWLNNPEHDRNRQFLHDATEIIKREPRYHVINLIDTASIIRISAPEGRRPDLVNYDLHQTPGSMEYRAQMLTEGKPVLSRPLEYNIKRSGMLLIYPVFVNNDTGKTFIASITGAFFLDDLLHDLFDSHPFSKIDVGISVDGSRLYPEDSSHLQDNHQISQDVSVSILGRTWHITTRLSQHHPINTLIANSIRFFYIGAVLSLVAAIFFYHVLISMGKARKSKLALTESENRYHQLFESNPIPMLVYDFSSLQILDVNNSAIAHYGYSREEFLLLTIKDIRPPEDVPKLLEKISSGCSGSNGYDNAGVWRHTKKNGAIMFNEITTHQIEFKKKEARLVLMNDVTEQVKAELERTKLEEQLRQAQKLEIVGQLAGGIAHDFNNLLQPIIAYADMSLQKLDRESPIYDDLIEIMHAGNRAKSLVHQLLAFSRKQILKTTIVDLNNTLKGIFSMLQRLIGEHIKVELDLVPTIGTIKADVSQIEQVILNLAVNARDAMPEGGMLIFSTSEQVIDKDGFNGNGELSEGTYSVIKVRDTGCGMDQNTITRIFEPFFTTKAPGKGTGLGLATAYGIAKQHGGTITVQATLGKGSEFAIYFPQCKGTPVQISEQPRKSTPEPRKHITILVVEDEKTVRKPICRYLKNKGFTIFEAENGNQALKLSTDMCGDTDLLISDVIMPDLNGKELYNRLVEKYPGLQVIFMSGYSDEIIAQKGILDASVHFLHKPFTMDSLLAMVYSVFPPSASAESSEK